MFFSEVVYSFLGVSFFVRCILGLFTQRDKRKTKEQEMSNIDSIIERINNLMAIAENEASSDNEAQMAFERA